MKYLKTLIILSIICTFTSCDLLKDKDITQQENVALVTAELEKDYPEVIDSELVKITFQGEQLNNNITTVSLSFKKDSDIKGKTIYLGQGGRVTDMNMNLPFYKLEERKPLKYKDFDLSNIAKYVEDADKMVVNEMENYVLQSVYKYSIYAPLEGSLSQEEKFTLNYIDDTESTELEGDQIVTNYYSYDFIVNKDGEVEPVE